MLVAPQVTLRTRPDNLVQVSLAVAGQLVLQSGTEILQAQIILTTSIAVGLATIVNGDKLTVGLDLSSANVTSVTACILTGEPLHPTFEGALRSQQVLDSLTKTLRSIPPSLVQTTPTASIFGVDIWLGTIIDNVETLVSRNISQSINGSLSTQPLVNPIQAVTQLPNTNAPNWWMTMNDMVLSAEGAENYVTATLFPPVLGTGSSFPYLLMTDQDVSSPDAVTTGERIDGQFFYPGISWGSPQQAQPSTWDVHKINPIGIILKVPPGLFHPQDPTVYARWEVKRTDTGQTIISKNFGIGQAGAPANIFTVSIDHASTETAGRRRILHRLPVVSSHLQRRRTDIQRGAGSRYSGPPGQAPSLRSLESHRLRASGLQVASPDSQQNALGSNV